MSGCGRRYHLITGQVETVCQNRCPVLTDAIRIRQCSDLLCEVEPSEVATSCYRYRIYVNAPFGSFLVINVSHFYWREGGEIGKSGETARTCESSFVRAIAAFRGLVGIEQRSHHSIYTIYTLFELVPGARCSTTIVDSHLFGGPTLQFKPTAQLKHHSMRPISNTKA